MLSEPSLKDKWGHFLVTGPWHLYEKRPKLFEKQEFRREHLPPLDRYSSAHVGNAADSCILGRYFFARKMVRELPNRPKINKLSNEAKQWNKEMSLILLFTKYCKVLCVVYPSKNASYV